MTSNYQKLSEVITSNGAYILFDNLRRTEAILKDCKIDRNDLDLILFIISYKGEELLSDCTSVDDLADELFDNSNFRREAIYDVLLSLIPILKNESSVKHCDQISCFRTDHRTQITNNSIIDNIDDVNLFMEYSRIIAGNLSFKDDTQKEQLLRIALIWIQSHRSIFFEVKSGTYLFSDPEKIELINNTTNKVRTIYTFKRTNINDHYILKIIAFLLSRKYDYLFSPNLFSFRTGNGVYNSIKYLMSHDGLFEKYSCKVDISDYYNSIDVDCLLELLKKDVDRKTFEIIENILQNPFYVVGDERTNSGYRRCICKKKGVMAGLPISSFLSNYYLRDIDWYFYSKSIPYSRFADDIIFFADTREELIELLNKIEAHIIKRGLHLNNKTTINCPHDKIHYLGLYFKDGLIDIDDNALNRVKKKVKNIAKKYRKYVTYKGMDNYLACKLMVDDINNYFFSEKWKSWTQWYFKLINTSDSLLKIDHYILDNIRFVKTGRYNELNKKYVPYYEIKKYGCRSLVHEFYRDK